MYSNHLHKILIKFKGLIKEVAQLVNWKSLNSLSNVVDDNLVFQVPHFLMIKQMENDISFDMRHTNTHLAQICNKSN